MVIDPMEKIEGSEVSRHIPEEKENITLKGVKITVDFKIESVEAKSVGVAGTFNDWEPKRTPLKKNGKGWKASVSLPRGRYEYRFVVDGQWLTDPAAKESVPNPFGGVNSVLSL